MNSLITFSHEILHSICIEVDPEDLASLSLTCKSLSYFIQGNNLLWKQVYLQHYDKPSREIGSRPDSWSSELQRVVEVEKLLSSSSRTLKRAYFPQIASTVIDLVGNATGPSSKSKNLGRLIKHFEQQENVDALLCASSLFVRAGTIEQQSRDDLDERQLSAKLHTLYGVPVGVRRRFSKCPGLEAHLRETSFDSLSDEESLDIFPYRRRTRSSSSSPTHIYARAKVYDLRNYTTASMWGPFLNDGSARVDWEKMEAIMVDLDYNMWRIHERARGEIGPWWGKEGGWVGASSHSYQSKLKEPEEEDGYESEDHEQDDFFDFHPLTIPETVLSECPRDRDPYGVTGTWMRVVCFLHYTDLHTFNFGSPRNRIAPREPGPLRTDEAIRLISLELVATVIEPPGPNDGQALPVVHFVGTSKSMNASSDPNAYSRIKGTVRLTPEGEVRWTTFSIFHGNEERWRSEGIQVGGVKAGRGILGNWFDKNYDERGPAGPTAFWKISDEVKGLGVESAPGSPA